MLFSSWLRNWKRAAPVASRPSPLAPRRFRPLLEILEDRTLLSTYVVDTLTDTGAGSGLTGDLRYCITKATSGNDTITFAQGLTGTINLESALPNLNASVSIQGPGASLLKVEPGAIPMFDSGSTATVEISGLTIVGVIANSGTLTVSACNLVNYIANSGTLAVSACNLYLNSASCAITNSGTATVSDSDVSEDALFVTSPIVSPIDNTGTMTISNSAFQGVWGSVIANSGVLTVNYSTLAYNHGSGLTNFGTATVNYSTLAGNVGGGGIFNQGALTINNCLLNGNYDSVANGGGICMSAGTLSINSSTLEANQAAPGLVGRTSSGATTGGGSNGGDAVGGGLYIAAGTVSINNSTIADNWANGGNGSVYALGDGGGIYNAAGPGALRMYDTILADNSATTGDPDLDGGVTSLGHNLIGNSTGGSGFAASDLVNVNPQLGPLQNNGGPTETMALLPGSPAIGAGDTANAPADDQRGFGFPRIVGGAIDIGAFEVQAASPPVTPAVIQLGPAYGPSTGGTTVTIAGANLGTPATATVDFGSNNPATIVSDNGSQLVVLDPSWTPGSGTVDVTVTTAAGTSATSPADQFTYVRPITLSPSTVPVATANQSYSATITASGGSGGYTFALASGSSLPAGLNLSSSGILAGTMPTAGSYIFTVVASDTFYTGVTGSQQYTLTVRPASTLTLSPSSLPTATVGDSYGPVTITASGGSGSYTLALATGSNLPAGLTLTSAGVLSGKPTTSTGSPFRVTITATDKSYSGLTSSTAYTLTVDPAITVSPATLPAATATDAVNDKLTAKGGSGAGYTFALASGSSLPNGLTLTSAGAITGTPTQPGKYTFTIVATDSIRATGTQACTLTVSTRSNALTVTNTNDHGGGSLRAEIAAARSGDIILFSPTLDGKTIALSSGELDLTKNLTILGPGAGQLTISGNSNYSYGYHTGVFEVALHTTVTLSGLSIIDGFSQWDGYGGGILNHGALTVSACTIDACYALNEGGGIFSDGTLTVTGCTISGNNASDGAGIWNGGAATIVSSTIANNWAQDTSSGTYQPDGAGGGIFNHGTLTLSGCTVSANYANGVGGGTNNILNNGTLTVENSSTIWDAYNSGVLYLDGTSTIGTVEGNPAIPI